MSRTLIVGQSGGPTAVINGSLAGVIEEAQGAPGIDRILGMRRGVEGLLEGDVVDLSHLVKPGLERLARTPGSALGACRRKITEDEAARLLQSLQALDAGYFCYIGGNDSADTTRKVAIVAARTNSDLRAVAVPKTIDNDLPETDHCPGYGSIARYVAVATAESTLDTRSLPTNYPVKIIEVMGRDTGWVAAASGLARLDPEDGPHLIYTPEHAFEKELFLASVADIHRQLGYAVAVVAETVRDGSGAPIAADLASVDDFGHPIIRGTAESLVRLVEQELGIPARFDKPGTLQRSSIALVSETDLSEAREAGRAAVRLALSGLSDCMVTIQRTSDAPYSSTMASVGLDRIANRQRLLPREFLDESGTFIAESFRRYATPLLGPNPFFEYARV